jgi:hypothetical protein
MTESMSTSGERGDIQRYTEAIPSRPSQRGQAVFVPSILQASRKELSSTVEYPPDWWPLPSVSWHQPVQPVVNKWNLSKSRALLATSAFRASSLIDELECKQNSYLYNRDSCVPRIRSHLPSASCKGPSIKVWQAASASSSSSWSSLATIWPPSADSGAR